MNTQNLSTLKIHKLTQAQYDRELAAGNIDETALYLTPDEDIDLSGYATIEQLNAKADTAHSHDDVYYTETEIDTKLEGKADSTHTHTVSDISNLQSIIIQSDTGTAYTATIDGITELTAGTSFIMIPNIASTTATPTLNVNDLGAKYIRRRLSNSTSTAVAGSSANWIGANKPVRVTYDGTCWVVDLSRPSATDIYGTVPIASGGTGASDGATALANLFAAGYTVLSSYQYGDTLPEPGVPGRIFFKKVSS